MRIFLASLVSAACLLCQSELALGQDGQPQARKFTNSDGRSVEATFLKATGGFAKLTRVADGLPFIVEISDLSEEDQEWIRAQSTKVIASISKRQDFGKGWRRLEIRMPGVLDVPQVVGMRRSSVIRRLDAFTHEIILPLGSWIKFNVMRREGNLEALVQFEGAEKWDVSIDGFITRLRRDAGPAKTVGISLPVDNAESFLAQLSLAEITEPISIELRALDHHDLLATVPFAIHGIVCRDVNSDEVALLQMSAIHPKAVAAKIDHENLPLMETFKELEALGIELENIPSPPNSEPGRKVAAVSFDVPEWPALLDLSFEVAAAPSDFSRVIRRQAPNLRMLHFSVRSNRVEFAEWAEMDRLKNLESLHIHWGIHVQAGEIAKLENLRSLSIAKPGLRPSDPTLLDLAQKQDLIHVDCRDSSHPDSLWEKWSRSGGLSSSVKVDSYQDFDLTDLENVEMLMLRSRKSDPPRGASRIAELGGLKQLRYLGLSYVTQEELDAIGSLPNRDLIEGVRVSNGDFSDLSPLRNLPNLKRLLLISHHGDDSVLDLRHFPSITTFNGDYLDGLTTIIGILDHPTLESISLRSCPDLTGFGDSVPNSRLKMLDIYRCSSLPNLNAFSQTNGLQQLRLMDCALEGPATLTETNPIRYQYIRNAGIFPDREVHDP